MMWLRLLVLVPPFVLTLALGARRAPAGSPLIGGAIEIGDAPSLPWGDEPFASKRDYDLERLVPDTLALLRPDTPVLARMETLRRATLYSARPDERGRRHEKLAWELVARLLARALDGEASGAPDGYAWFDAGYLVAASKEGGVATGFDGYAYARRGRALLAVSPEVEFALALMRRMGDTATVRAAYEEHLTAALADAREGTLLARNLLAHLGEGARSLAELRARRAARTAPGPR